MAQSIQSFRRQKVAALLNKMETHHSPTYQHGVRVGQLARRLGTIVGRRTLDLDSLQDAGALHDIGKLSVPSRLLDARRALRPDEIALFKSCPDHAFSLLRSLGEDDDVCVIVRAVHERYDGRGYPNQLMSLDIPVGARVIAVADAYDAMINRSWGMAPLTPAAALRELRAGAGSQFDPEVVGALLPIVADEQRHLQRSASAATAFLRPFDRR